MSSDVDMNDYLKAFSVADSKKKIDDVEMILNKKIGTNWRQIVFLMFVVIISVILLIVYGINIDNNPYKNTLSHIKVFFIILLISICFFFIWVIIKPRIDNQQKGVVPFPPSDTLVPVDSTQCGIVPTICTNSNDCVSSCTDKDGKCYYSCQQVTHPNTYYLGTKLDVGKSYCLPNIAQFNDVSKCGTYTGRIVWAKNPDGTLSWQCQCLYPDLFYGSDCTKQISCAMNYIDQNGIPQSTIGQLVDSNKNVFSSSVAPPGDVKTPYDLTSDGTPRFKCSCLKGFYTKDNDPFTCNQDICYVGESTTDDAYFDQNTNKCVCKPPLYRSNISGFCYPVDSTEPYCNLNTKGDGCRYSADIFFYSKNEKQYKPVMFFNDGKYYMADKRDMANEHLLDITDLVNSNNNIDKSRFIDITDTILKDAFYSFPVKIATEDYIPDISDNLNLDMKAIMEGIVLLAGEKDGENKGLARKCNSYFYRWGSSDKYPDCQNPLSKTGTEPIARNIDCVGKKSKIVIDLNYKPWGYHCDCGIYGRKNPGCRKVQTGWYTTDDGNQVYGQYIDKVVCNDYDKEYIENEGPQTCIEDCKADGESIDTGRDYTQCCLYETDDQGGIPNVRVARKDKIYWQVPDNDTIIKDGKCAKRARTSCQHDSECIGTCSHMDSSDDDKQICCPNLVDYLGKKIIYWCNGLEKGEKCDSDGQCISDNCSGNRCQ